MRQAFTDEQGSFRIVGCSFVAHSLEVRRDTIQPLPHGELQGVRPTREDLRIVVLGEPRAATLRGRVVGAELVGLAHLATRRRGSVDTGLWPLDPQDGSFEASSLAPGLHALELWSQERSYSLGVEVELRAGEERDLGTLAVPAPAGLVVQLDGPAHPDPIRLRLVDIENSSGLLGESADLWTGDRFEFETLPPGRYWVSAERRGARLTGAEVDLVAGAREVVRIGIDPHPPVHVLLETGEPGEPYVQLRLLDGAGQVRCLSWYPALRGITFRLDLALPPGPYVCEIWGAGRRLERFETTVPEAPDPATPLATWTIGG